VAFFATDQIRLKPIVPRKLSGFVPMWFK